MSEVRHDQASTADREIVITRVLNAPREVVFKAWTHSKHVAQWWGPRGVANTLSEMDVRPGGVWRFVMDGPDGTEYKNQISFIEVVELERLVYAHRGDGAEAHEAGSQYHVTVSFAEQDGQTKITMRMLFDSAQERDRTARFGAIRGGNQMLDRLQQYLAAGESPTGAEEPLKQSPQEPSAEAPSPT